MDLSKLAGAGRGGIQLSGAQVSPLKIAPATASYDAALTVSPINISAALTQLASVDVPAGKRMRVLTAALSNLGTTGDISAEIEIDGVVVLTGNLASHTNATAALIGSTAGTAGAPDGVVDLVVESNIKIRAKRTGANAAAFTLKYILEGA